MILAPSHARTDPGWNGMADTREVAEDVTGLRVPSTARWIAEENPAPFTEALLGFLR
ncbi:MAG: hypothetical protein ABW221_25170 [Vicinamibacteria bacterium]